MTAKATFPDGSVMLFGDSYKKWFDQLAEFCAVFKMPRPYVELSPAKWIAYGGLKWCQEHQLQEALDHEAKGRKAADFTGWRRLSLIEERTMEKRVNFF